MSDFEQQHVHSVYEAIADKFDRSRYKVWPSVQEFLDNIVSEAKETNNSLEILEVGCGNGKNLKALYAQSVLQIHQSLRINLTGCDMSDKFIEMVKNNGIHCVKANAVELPFESDTFNYVLSVAVIHHLSTEERRVQAIRELIRVAKVDSLIFIQVWALEQLPNAKRQFTTQDNMVSWKNEYDRFYHVFKENELETLITENFGDNVTIEDRKYDYGNWLVILKKLRNLNNE